MSFCTMHEKNIHAMRLELGDSQILSERLLMTDSTIATPAILNQPPA